MAKSIKSFNAPGKGKGLGERGPGGTARKVDSGHLVSPVAYSRQTRDLNRTKKPLDKRMKTRAMR